MMDNLFKAKYRIFRRKIITILVILAVYAFSSITGFAETSNPVISEKELTVLPPTNNSSIIAMLNNMQQAVLNTDYQISFVTQEPSQFSNILKYTHIGSDNSNDGSLLYLEGPLKEIILHNNIVSYFQSDSESFSLPTNRIIEVFPDFIYHDFNQLTKYYDFVLLGKSRTANRSSQLIRILPKDKDRYNYILWLDEKTNLPLRIDLLDQNSKIIKQMKVLTLDTDFNKVKFKQYIEQLKYPILFPVDKGTAELGAQQVTWLPKGFTSKINHNINLHQTDIDSQLFSDGIFSFTIYLSKVANEKFSYSLEQGDTTIYTTNLDDVNIVIIGDLPLETIERIAKSIKNK